MKETETVQVEWIGYGEGDCQDIRILKGQSGGRGGDIIRKTIYMELTEEQIDSLIHRLEEAKSNVQKKKYRELKKNAEN